MATTRSKGSKEEAESGPIPNVIYIQEKTLLCRWDGSGNSNTDVTTDDLSTSSSLLSDDGDDNGPDNVCTSDACSPPKAPKRSFSPPRARKHRQASQQSGVDIHSVRLVPVSFCNTSTRRSAPLMACTTSLGQILTSDTTTPNKVTAVFCIRREGCGSCRDHGLQLAQLSQQFPNTLKLVGVVKKSNWENDKALRDFYNKYFPFPIYRDDQWGTFRFLGNRRISPWKLMTTIPPWAFKRGIHNVPIGGEHQTQGGILLFDQTGQLRFVYYERYGEELDLDALKWAIQDCCCQEEKTTAANPVVKIARPPRRPQRSNSIKRGDTALQRPTRRGSTAL